MKTQAELKQPISCKILSTQVSQKADFQHQWTVNYIVVLQPRFIKFYNSDEEKHEIMLQKGYTEIPFAYKLLLSIRGI